MVSLLERGEYEDKLVVALVGEGFVAFVAIGAAALA
jgi:hypothetical protein